MVQVQIKDKKAARITVVCLLISLIFLAAVLAVKLIKCKDYVPVQGTIVDSYISTGTHNNLNSRHRRVRYAFQLDGKDYEASRFEGPKMKKNLGKVKTIRVNPDDPTMLEDAWGNNGLIIILCGGTAILALLVIGLKQEKKQAYRREV